MFLFLQMIVWVDVSNVFPFRDYWSNAIIMTLQYVSVTFAIKVQIGLWQSMTILSLFPFHLPLLSSILFQAVFRQPSVQKKSSIIHV